MNSSVCIPQAAGPRRLPAHLLLSSRPQLLLKEPQVSRQFWAPLEALSEPLEALPAPRSVSCTHCQLTRPPTRLHQPPRTPRQPLHLSPPAPRAEREERRSGPLSTTPRKRKATARSQPLPQQAPHRRRTVAPRTTAGMRIILWPSRPRHQCSDLLGRVRCRRRPWLNPQTRSLRRRNRRHRR